MIQGVLIHPLKQIPDERGKIMHMLRCDDPHFEKFGEIYFSMVYPKVVKGWHLHKEQTQNYCVVVGEIRLVLYDDREGSPTRGEVMEIPLGGPNYALVRIPPLLWNGYQGLGDQPSIVANCSTLPHRPDEIVRLDPHSPQIPYRW